MLISQSRLGGDEDLATRSVLAFPDYRCTGYDGVYGDRRSDYFIEAKGPDVQVGIYSRLDRVAVESGGI